MLIINKEVTFIQIISGKKKKPHHRIRLESYQYFLKKYLESVLAFTS